MYTYSRDKNLETRNQFNNLAFCGDKNMKYDYSNSSKQYSYPQNKDSLLDKGIGSKEFFTILEKELPPVFTRRTASSFIGGIISPKTMSNLDSLGKGPLVKVRVGGKVGYERDSFMIWLKQKLK